MNKLELECEANGTETKEKKVKIRLPEVLEKMSILLSFATSLKLQNPRNTD